MRRSAAPGVAIEHRPGQLDQQLPVGDAQHVGRHLGGQPLGAHVGDRLVEQRQAVAHRAGRLPRDQTDRLGRGVDLLGAQDLGRGASVSRAVEISLKSKRWQRDRIVAGILCTSVVAKTNTTCGGGSSSVLSSALNECADSMWTSSMM